MKRILMSLAFLGLVGGHLPLAKAAEGLTEAETEILTVNEKVSAPEKESEILLNLDNSKKAASEGSGLFRILFTVSILGLVGMGAYIFLRKYKVPQAAKHQMQIKVLQQHYLGPKKSLAIVRVAGESILIGVTDHNISMIKSLSLLDDEVPEETPESFGKVLKGARTQADFTGDSIQEAASFQGAERSSETSEDDEFSISGIKDIVSKRLKGMRSIQ